jgi:hypothetical protein
MAIPTHQYGDPTRTQRRQFRRQILLPMGLGALVLIGALLALIPLSRQDVSIIADLMLSCLCLLPMVICLFPIYMLATVSVFMLNRADSAVTKQVRRVRGATETLRVRTDSATDEVNERVMGWSVRVAALNVLFDFFDRPPAPPVTYEGEKDQNAR